MNNNYQSIQKNMDFFKQFSIKFYVKTPKKDFLNRGGSLFYMIVKSINKNFNGLNSIISFYQIEHKLTRQKNDLPNVQLNISNFSNQNLIKIKKLNDPIQITFPLMWNANKNLKSYTCVRLVKNNDINFKQKYKNKINYLQQRHEYYKNNNDGFFNWESSNTKFVSLNLTAAVCEFNFPSGGIFAIMNRPDKNIIVRI